MHLGLFTTLLSGRCVVFTPVMDVLTFRSRFIIGPGTDDAQYALDTEFKRRPGFNTTGKPIQLALNSYPVTQFPQVKVLQYDVSDLTC